jgi:hypothetical protein
MVKKTAAGFKKEMTATIEMQDTEKTEVTGENGHIKRQHGWGNAVQVSAVAGSDCVLCGEGLVDLPNSTPQVQAQAHSAGART